jgi:orotidine-5'-phosphate decarboxylase
VGAVVGATHPEAGARLREIMPHTFFLVPGYGAQGGAAADVARFFDRDGRGCLVNSSRGIIAAWKQEGKGAGHVGKAAREAVLRMKGEIAAAL